MIVQQLKQHFGAFGFYLAGGILLVGAIFLGYKFGNFLTDSQLKETATLKHSLENLNVENNELTRKLNVLGVELEVQRLANQQAQKSIEQGLEREADLKRQLGFYQKVMAPELKQEGFVIDAFNVEQTLSDNVYRFDLVLMQQDKIKSVVKGNVDVTLTGSQEGKPKEIRLFDLMVETSEPLTFSFKYFQVLKGQFAVPENFRPEKIVIRAEVFQFRKKRGDLERSFDWVIEHNPVPQPELDSE